jgi:hypothetical protein
MMRLFNLSGTRAFTEGKSRILWWACMALLSLMAIFGVGSIVALSVNCSPLTFAQSSPTAECPDQVLAFQVVRHLPVLTMAAASSMETNHSSRRRH